VCQSQILKLNQKRLEKLNDTKNHEHIIELETFLPGVLNKLTLCVYHMATIMPEVLKEDWVLAQGIFKSLVF
jgi:hypothetical protein